MPKKSDYVALVFFTVILTLVSVQGVFSWSGNQNTLGIGFIETPAINSSDYYLDDVYVTDRLEGDYTDTGLTTPWLDLNGDNRTAWPTGGGGSGNYTSTGAVVGQNIDKSGYENYYYCDGTADDVQIQLAVTEGWKLIGIENGTYDITDATILLDNVTIWGQGQATKLVQANGINNHVFYAFQKEGIVIRDLLIDGNKKNNPTLGQAEDGHDPGGIHLERCTDSKIYRVTIWNYRAYGVHIGNPDSRRDSVIDVQTYHAGYDGINVVGGNHHIIGCYVYNSSDHGITILGWSSTIQGCHIQDMEGKDGAGNGHVGLSIQGQYSSQGKTCSITGNTVDGARLAITALHAYGQAILISDNVIRYPNLDDSVVQGIRVNNGTDWLITNNVFGPNWDADAVLWIYHGYNVTFSNNYIHGDGEDGTQDGNGVHIESDAYARNQIVVTLNTFINMKGYACEIRDSTGSEFTNNIVVNADMGLWLNDVAGSNIQPVISGNTFRFVDTGIYGEESVDAWITNNRFYNCTTPLDWDNAGMIRPTLHGNGWYGCTNDPTTVAVTTPNIRDNIDKDGGWWATES